MIYIIMNNMSSLICIFLIEKEKMILIIIFVILNDLKTMIIVISYISLIDDLEKWYKSAKINCFYWTSDIMQRIMIIVIIFDTKTSEKFQIYTWDLFREDRLSNIYFDEVYILWMKRYFRQKFKLFRWLYLFIS